MKNDAITVDGGADLAYCDTCRGVRAVRIDVMEAAKRSGRARHQFACTV